MKRLLITSPHSFCIPACRRHCDRVALSAVNYIKQYDNDYDIQFHVSDRLREEGDYNRPITDGEPWREHLRELAKKQKPHFVLEVHSFPGDHPIYMKRWGDADLVVLESAHNVRFIDKLIERIHYHSDWNFTIKKDVPWHPVSLTDDLAPLYKHALFEFNEDGKSNDSRKILARAIVEAAVDIDKLQNNEYIDTTKLYIRSCVRALYITSLIIFLIIVIYFLYKLSSDTRFLPYLFCLKQKCNVFK